MGAGVGCCGESGCTIPIDTSEGGNPGKRRRASGDVEDKGTGSVRIMSIITSDSSEAVFYVYNAVHTTQSTRHHSLSDTCLGSVAFTFGC